MQYPKMIIFDYGHTLLYEPGWDPVRGNAELLKYAVKNPYSYTLEDVRKAAELIFGEHIENIRKIGYDIGGQIGDKVLYEYLGIEFSLTPLEMETVFWNGASMGAIMPRADIMLDYINKKGIRSAVLSNLLWSGDALSQRLNRLLPMNKFEFVMTSSDYIVRKPNRILFDIALRKAGLRADEIWYCGDSIKADIYGAKSVGMFPVLYEGETPDEPNPFAGQNDGIAIDFDYLHIHDWQEMIDIISTL